MTLDDLRVFVAVCDAGSLSAVARSHGTTQPAVSQHVRRLERELGATLFERGRRGVTPTAAGAILLSGARDALAAIDGGRRRIEQLQAGDSGTLRVATGGTTLRHFMMRPLAAFRRRHPTITFEYVSAGSTRECAAALRADRADLAFVTTGADDGVEHRSVVRTPWVLVTTSDDALASRPSVRSRDLRDIRAIGMPAGTTSRAQLEDGLSSHGVRLHFSTTVVDWDTAVQLVELGLGQAIVPALWVHDLGRHRSLRALPIADLRLVAFGWSARRWDALPPFALAFTRLVTDGLAALGPNARAELVEPANLRQ